MPADFFGHPRSFHVKSSKPKILSNKTENDIFNDFISMFKMGQGLKKMAKRFQEDLNTKGEKENI